MVMVLARDVAGSIPGRSTFRSFTSNLAQVVHTCVSLTKQYNLAPVNGRLMPCGWEGNRRSGIALAMRHSLQWFIHLRAHGLDREMSTPPTLSCGVWPSLLHLISQEKTSVRSWPRRVVNAALRIPQRRSSPSSSRFGERRFVIFLTRMSS